MWIRRRTVNILTGRVLAASCTTLVRTGLSILGLVGQIGRIVGCRIRLGVGAQDEGKRDESKETHRGR